MKSLILYKFLFIFLLTGALFIALIVATDNRKQVGFTVEVTYVNGDIEKIILDNNHYFIKC